MKLTDKYSLERGRVYLTGIQALVRLPMDRMRRDRRAGLNTAAFISGYEGSPLGGYDLALARARGMLAEHNIHFQPGVNEDLAATSVMGSQIAGVLGQSKFDGVVGIWYGKGPGVDRSGDIFRHANLAGSGKNGAALVLAGDDHASKSSTIPHQSDFSLFNAGMPFFFPGNTQDILDFGQLAIALSRFSGAWVGMKLVTDVCDGGGTADVAPDTPPIQLPGGYEKYVDARLVPPYTLALEQEVNARRLEAALEFARLNRVNRWHGAREAAWLGIASAGKAYFDLAQALRDLGMGERELDSLGIRVAKFGMTFPLEARFAEEFAAGLETILVIEEKRSFLEMLLKDALYRLARRPAVIGKQDETGAALFPPSGELDADAIAKVLGPLVARRGTLESIGLRLRLLEQIEARPRELSARRAPNFCSGCPHNRSTLLLEGQAAGGGIGCHTMAMQLEDSNRSFSFLTQMGGEGAPWIGMAPFVERGHVFQNMGDGTFFHSGSLAVEACIAARVNIPFKILSNGHVAMTGGQDAAGALPVPRLTRKLEAEGVRKTIVLAEDTTKYSGIELAANAELRGRGELLRTLGELEKIPGVTVIIYDQECAAEKRRKRSRGKLAEPVLRLVINEEVCEGCGDCVRQSNCMSLTPVATEFGQKTRIHQSSCNKDYTCALGDCPSFVTVKLKPGTGLRKRALPDLPPADVPAPREMAAIGNGYRILCPGIGGTGVVTINALLATAAWIDGLSVITLDQTGSAQKGGAVLSHILLSGNSRTTERGASAFPAAAKDAAAPCALPEKPLDAPAKTNAGNADLILGFDLIGAAHPDTLRCAMPNRTTAVLNTNLTPTMDAVRSGAPLHGPQRMIDAVNAVTRPGRNIFADASRIAEGLFGSHMAVNLFLTGAAWQAGLIPISEAAVEQAIEWNGVDAERNLRVFQWGRKYYHDAQWVENFLTPQGEPVAPRDAIALRVRELTNYRNADYAAEYLQFLEKVESRAPELKDAVARNLYKLMAYKDEYEVARLLTRPEFATQMREMWEAPESISYNLHPPLLRRMGLHKKVRLGAWFRTPLRLLAAAKRLRGTQFDVFGYAAHRRQERELIGWYRDLVGDVLEHSGTNPVLALEIAELPDRIRGYERIKEQNIGRTKAEAAEKLAALRQAQRVSIRTL
ncbi:MAG: indolepyruvate ferredoxin oxidoreductase family protein [Bryobacteraceae bacterium]